MPQQGVRPLRLRPPPLLTHLPRLHNNYVINVKQITKFVKEGMIVGVDRPKYSIQILLTPRINPTVSLAKVKDTLNVTTKD